MSYKHIADDCLREFAECDDPGVITWDFAVEIVDSLADCYDADALNEDVSYEAMNARNEALDAAHHALGIRNRIELQSAVRDFFLDKVTP